MTYYIAKLLSTLFFTTQAPEPPYTLAEKVGLWLTFIGLITSVGSLLALAVVMILGAVR